MGQIGCDSNSIRWTDTNLEKCGSIDEREKLLPYHVVTTHIVARGSQLITFVGSSDGTNWCMHRHAHQKQWHSVSNAKQTKNYLFSYVHNKVGTLEGKKHSSNFNFFVHLRFNNYICFQERWCNVLFLFMVY